MGRLDENGLLYLWQRFKAIFVTKDEMSNYGAGDMLKSTYDTNNNGKVDHADTAANALKFGGQLPAYYATAAELQGYVPTNTIGQASGVASLDESGKVPESQLPEKAPIQHIHAMSDVTGLENAISTMTGIAQGKCKAEVFDTVEELDTWLADENNRAGLNTGDVFYIRAVDVPDYWWDGETGTKQILETTKVDLSVITNAEIDEILAT